MDDYKVLIHGIRWTSLSLVIQGGGNLLLLLILVRLLDKEAFALIALSNVVINLFLSILQSSFGNAIIQHKSISKEQLSTLFWLELFCGGGVLLITIVIGQIFVIIYDDKLIGSVLGILSLTFLISPLGNQFRALLQKRMAFNSIAKVEIAVFFAGFCISLFLALRDFGVYALVGGVLARISTEAVLYLIIGVKIQQPKFLKLNLKTISPFINFGFYQAIERVIVHITFQWDVLLIGKLLGMEALGVYEVFKRILVRITNLVGSVIDKINLPMIAKKQDDKLWISKYYLQTLSTYNALCFPIYVGFIILSKPFLVLFFEGNWTDYLFTFKLLSFYILLISINNPLDSLLIAIGKIKRWVKFNSLLFIVFPIGIFIGSLFDLNGVIISLIILAIIILLFAYLFLISPYLPMNFNDYMQKAILTPLILSLLGGLPVLLLLNSFNFHYWGQLFLGISTFFLVYTCLNLFFNKPFMQYIGTFFSGK